MAQETTRRAPRRANNPPRRSRPEKRLVLMIRMLKDRESKPFMTQAVELRTSHAQHVFNRVYDKLSNALYRSDEVLMTVDAPMAARLQTSMDKNFQGLFDDLVNEETRLDALQEAQGVAGEVHYTVAKEELAVIYSPRASRFVLLMRTLDRVVTKIDLLHISGIIETTHATLAKWTWERTIIRFANEIIMASNKALQQTRSSLITKTQKERDKALAKMQTAAEGAEAAAAVSAGDYKADMPAPHEIEQAIQHPVVDVEAIPETDDDDDIAQLEPRGRTRTPKLAAAAG